MAGHFKGEWKQLAVTAHFDCKALARLNNISVRQLQRIFRSHLGRTPQDWLNEQRVLAARQSLLLGDSVKKVALELGYKQSSHFCRQFKVVNGVTPGQYKRATFKITDVALG